MTSKETLKKILKLIASGKIPKELYNEYLGDTEIGFMNFEDLNKYFMEKKNKPTLEEVKKEWEEKGYKCVCDSENELIFEETLKEPFFDFACHRVHILKNLKLYDISFITKLNGKQTTQRLPMNIIVHQLLTKTFRALGWFDE